MIPLPTQPDATAQAARPRAASSALACHPAMAALVALFVLLGGLYNANTPVFEAPDETSHFRYVRYILEERRLPPLRVSDHDVTQGEMHQPPLYYLLGALVTAPLNTGPVEDAYLPNPYATLGRADAPGNKNAVLHAEESLGTPSPGAVRAMRVLRALSTLLAAGTVLLTYHIALQLLPGRRALATGSAALVALNPQFLFIGAAASNDALAAFLATAALYLALRVVNGEGRSPLVTVLLGLAVGLGMLAKVSVLAAGALVPLAYGAYYRQRPAAERHAWRDLVRPVLAAGAVALAVGGWWYARNAVLYDDLLAMDTMRAVFGVYERPLSVGQTLRVLYESLISYWGVFGWMNVLADEAYYTAVRILTGLGALGLGLAAVWFRWRKRSTAPHRWYALGLAAVWALVMLAAYTQFARTITGPQGRLLFPAAAPIAFFLALGLTSWAPRRYSTPLLGGLAALLLVVAVLAPLRYIAPAYAAPRRVALEEAPGDMADLSIRFGEDLFLLGYSLPQESVQAGGTLRVRLYWVALRAVPEDLTIALRVYGAGGEVIGTLDTFPGMGASPTRSWMPGEVIYDEAAVRVRADAAAPVAARLRVGVYRPADLTHLSAFDAQGRDIGQGPEIARVRVAPAVASVGAPEHALQANFGDQVMLEGYAFDRRVRADEVALSITFYWRCLAPLGEDWTIFAHILDASGEKVAQVDEQPLAGDYPTGFWQAGETIADEHTVLMLGDLPAGRYTMQVGLYRLPDLQRLPVVGGEPGATYTTIGPITVESR